jgi:hypothetical protein
MKKQTAVEWLQAEIDNKYPIEVQCYWETNGYQSYPKMECDSINGDAIYKDGLIIKSKTIINVSFK